MPSPKIYFFLFLLMGCSTEKDYPQALAGIDTIEIKFREAGKDTIWIRQKRFIKQIANSLTSPLPAPSATQHKKYAQMRFSRQNGKYILLEGDLAYRKDSTELFFICPHKKTFHHFKLPTDVQNIIWQARKYPTLLKN